MTTKDPNSIFLLQRKQNLNQENYSFEQAFSPPWMFCFAFFPSLLLNSPTWRHTVKSLKTQARSDIDGNIDEGDNVNNDHCVMMVMMTMITLRMAVMWLW